MTIRYVLFMPVKVYQCNIIAVNGAYGWLRSGHIVAKWRAIATYSFMM